MKYICRIGLFRSDRLHIHLWRMVDGRPVGIPGRSGVGVVIGGDECDPNGMVPYESASSVVLAGGFDGESPGI